MDGTEPFAVALRREVKATSKTITQVAAEVGVSYTTLRNYIAGRTEPGLAEIRTLVRAFPGLQSAVMSDAPTSDEKRHG